jgi:hypothetical protein
VEKAKQKGEGGGLVLETAIVELAKAFKEILQKLGVSVDQLCDIVMQHERRLSRLEGPGDLRCELNVLKRRVEALTDKSKREEGFEYLAQLCHVLGVEIVEE